MCEFIDVLKNYIPNNTYNQNIYCKRNNFRSNIQTITNKVIPIKNIIISPKKNNDKKYNIQPISNNEYGKKFIIKPKNKNSTNQQTK